MGSSGYLGKINKTVGMMNLRCSDISYDYGFHLMFSTALLKG